MARSKVTTRKHSKSNLKVVPAPSADGAEPPQMPADPEPTAAQDPETPFDPPKAAAPPEKKKNKGGRPEKKGFWDNVNAISPLDWQAKRYYIYAYLQEPFCNIKTQGEPGYLRKFYEPIDAEFILQEWGSGKYFLRLKEKRPGERTDFDVDTLSFEIFNPTYPPRLPRKLWENDPRNEKWLAMLPKEQKPQSQAEVMQIMSAMFDMQDRLEERMNGGAREPQSPNAILDTAERLIEMTQGKERGAAPAPIDPWEAASKILNMRSENPMVDVLRDELKSLREEMKDERAESRRLQDELRKAQTPAAAAAPKGILEQLTEFGAAMNAVKDTPLGRIFNMGPAAEAAAPIARSRMSGTMEFFKDTLPVIIEPFKPLINSFAFRLSHPTTPAGQPAQNGAAANGTGRTQARNPEEELIQFVERTLLDAILEYVNNGSGGTFAEFVYNGWPSRLRPMQIMTHHQMPGQQGPAVIVELFKHSDIWSQLASREPEFRTFVEEFCKWTPEGDQPPAVTSAAAPAEDQTENWETGEAVPQEDKG